MYPATRQGARPGGFRLETGSTLLGWLDSPRGHLIFLSNHHIRPWRQARKAPPRSHAVMVACERAKASRALHTIRSTALESWSEKLTTRVEDALRHETMARNWRLELTDELTKVEAELLRRRKQASRIVVDPQENAQRVAEHFGCPPKPSPRHRALVAAARQQQEQQEQVAAAQQQQLVTAAPEQVQQVQQSQLCLNEDLLATLRGTSAKTSSTLKLPTACTFVPIDLAHGVDVPLSKEGALTFASHTMFELPCDHRFHEVRFLSESEQADVRERGTSEQLADVIHRFTLRKRLKTRLSARLTKWAVLKERLAMLARQQSTPPVPGIGSISGVRKTNRGGYQSYHDIFCGQEDASLHRSLAGAREVHRIAGASMDELGLAHSQYPDEATRAYAGEVHPACGWVNVNRENHSNCLHVHRIDRWSAVYFVNNGEAADAVGSAGPLIFRGGPLPLPPPPAIPIPTAPQAAPATHSFMAVPPDAGSLWLFPGDIPHAVMRAQLPPGVESAYQPGGAGGGVRGDPRISIAINFEHACPPPRSAARGSMPSADDE